MFHGMTVETALAEGVVPHFTGELHRQNGKPTPQWQRKRASNDQSLAANIVFSS
jgi:hypothetical protein